MKRNIIALVLSIPLIFSACIDERLEPVERPVYKVQFNNEINPVIMDQIPATEELPPYATKSLISAQTTRHIQTQFLRIDELIDSKNKPLYTYPTWDTGYLTEASVISSPSNQDEGYMRSILLNPIQSYKIRVTTDPADPNKTDTTFYHTRMISWYPITCTLHKEEGVASVTQFNHFVKANVGYDAYTVHPDGSISINFRGLNGETDVMVSEVREAQHWHNLKDPGKNPSDYLPNDQAQQQAPIYRQPYGRNETNPGYNNCFKYEHYLSAVKVYAFAQNSDQNAAMWGRIKKVIVREQPSECSVTIPEVSIPELPTVATGSTIEHRTYGTAEFSKDNLVSFPLVKTPIYGEDTNADNLETAPENPSLEGTSKDKKVYLGYSLIAPKNDVVLDIHTESGIFSVKVKWQQQETDAEGNVISTTEVFKPGYIYNIVLNFGTGGTIAAILLKDSEGVFYDLSTGEIFGESSQPVYKYKTANSYIVDPSMTYVSKKDNKKHFYDGYTFLASTIGNGEDGLLPEFPHKSTTIAPVTAGIIWESKLGLITQVEYMYNYVRFKVQPPAVEGGAFDEGNAVIGVYDENGNILWSWHIWVTDKPKEYAFKVGSQEVTLMDRNLGATSAFASETGGELSTYGLYYQWGRKDPSMPPPTANYRPLSTATSSYYDYYGNEMTSTGIVTKEKPTIEDGVNNPMYIILPTSIPPYYAYDWLYYRINTLWGGNVMNIKTIYDPCPFGYRVPGEELRSMLSSNFKSARLSGNAYVYDVNDAQGNAVSIAFPLAGYKGVDRGMSSLTAAWKYVGEKGDYISKSLYPNGHRARTYLSKEPKWTETGAAANDEDGYGSKEFNYDNYIFTDYANRRTASSIRCIADTYLDNIGQVLAFIQAPSIILLGEQHKLKYGAQSVGGKLTNVEFTQTYNGAVTADIKKNPGVAKYEAEFTLPGSDPTAYESMGIYTYNIVANNSMGVENNRTKTVPVINVSELYDIKFAGKPIVGNIFDIDQKEYMSFKVNMRDKGAAGQAATTQEDLTLLFNSCETWVNGEHVGALYDESTNTFTTKRPVTLKPETILECKAKDGRVIKRYKMTGTESKEKYFFMGEKMANSNELVKNQYFAVSTTGGQKYWMHTGNSGNGKNDKPKQLQLEQITYNKNDVVEKKNIFRWNDRNIQITMNTKWLGKYFGARNPDTFLGSVINDNENKYKFNVEGDLNGIIYIGRDGGARSPWNIHIATYEDSKTHIVTEYLEWGGDGTQINTGTPWYFYKVDQRPVYQFSEPVEIPVQ